MTALFIGDSKIITRLSPLGAVRQDPAPTGTKLSEKMGQFMAQRAIDFGRMLRQSRVKPNEFLAIISAASACFQA